MDRGVDLEQINARLALAESNLVVTQANIENARTDYQAVIGYLPVSPVKPEPLLYGNSCYYARSREDGFG